MTYDDDDVDLLDAGGWISKSPWRFWPREEVEDRRVLLPVTSPDMADTLSASISTIEVPEVLVMSSEVDVAAAGVAAAVGVAAAAGVGAVGEGGAVSGLLKRLGGGACIAG